LLSTGGCKILQHATFYLLFIANFYDAVSGVNYARVSFVSLLSHACSVRSMSLLVIEETVKYYYIRQVNAVNGGIMIVIMLSVSSSL